MTDPTPHIISDLLIVLLSSLPLALMFFWLLKVPASTVTASSFGKVPCDHVNAMDLTIAIVLILQYVLMTSAPAGAASASSAAWCFLGLSVSMNTLFIQLIYAFAMISLLLAYYARVRRLSINHVFGLRRLAFWKILLLGIGLWLAAVLVLGTLLKPYVVYLQELGIKTDSLQDAAKTFVSIPDWDYRALFFVSAVIAAPVLEELVFRGFLYPVIKRYAGMWFALVFVSLLFGAIHQHLTSLPLLAMLGLFLNLTYEKTGCLWVPVMIHAIFNSASLINLSTVQ